ncbi:MAG: putative Ig domain-containing protein, partial [Campylobacterota bacterium]|nr:putative Ig domain-containing protein [Campylobacterota bacterium]
EVVQHRTIALEIHNPLDMVIQKIEWLDGNAEVFDDNLSATYHALDYLGKERVVVRLLSSNAKVAVATIEIETLQNTNKFTQISGTPQLTLYQGEDYSFTPQTVNEDGDPLNFYATNLPSWLRINIHTGQIDGTPDNSDVGIHKDVTIFVSDGKDPVSLTPFDITVINVNDAPTIVGNPPATASEDSNFSFMPTAHDIDSEVDGNSTILFFSAQNFPDWLSINTQTGQISGVPDYQDVTVLQGLRISVSDGQKSASMEFDLEVVAVNDAPIIEAVDDKVLSVYEDSDVTLTLNASDEENNSISFSAHNLPQWASLNTQTGVITGVPTNEFVGQSDLVTLFAKDSYGAESNISFRFVVINTNDAPLFKNVTTLRAQEDALYTFQIEVEDVDPDDLLIYSASNLPNWLYIRPADGEISGMPLNGDVGQSQITISVSDGNATVEQVFDLVVSNTNDAPTISGQPTRSYTPATVDFKFMPTYRDVDMDVVDETLNYTLTNNPSWMSINPDTGELYGRPATYGFYSGIVVTVSDGEASARLEPFDINVTPIKRALGSGQTLEYSNHDDGTYRLKGALRNFVASSGVVTLDSLELIWQDNADVGVFKKQWLEPLNYHSNRH